MSIVGIVVVFGVFRIIGSFNTPEKAEGREECTAASDRTMTTAVAPDRIVEDYISNEVAADNTYRGRLLEIRGEVCEIGKDLADRIYISLDGRHGDRKTQCFFNDVAGQTVATLKKGDTVTVQGECDGLTLWTVLLSDCRLSKTEGRSRRDGSGGWR